MKKRFNEFDIENDTPFWVVCVNGLYGRYRHQSEAERVYKSTGGTGGDDGLAETAFGSAMIYPPHTVSSYYSSGDKISHYHPIDIERYIRVHTERWNKHADEIAKKEIRNDCWNLLYGELTAK